MKKIKPEKRLHDVEYCFICGKPATDTHHMVGGKNRQTSEKFGLTCKLCRSCHDNLTFHNTDIEWLLKRVAQASFEYKYSHEEWMKEFGKSYF